MSILKYKLIFSILLLSLVSHNCIAAKNKLTGLDDFIKQSMDVFEVPGLAISVVSNDKIIYLKGYGTKTLGKNEPVNKDTLFAIGSASKNFTAAILGSLISEGKLSWDSKLSDLIPGFRVEDPYVTREATIRDALSHRTGVAAYDLYWRMPELSRSEVVAKMVHFPQDVSFRSISTYNNAMYVVAGHAAEKVSGKRYNELLEQRIFNPLGMKNSTASYKKLMASKNAATPHEVIDGKLVTVNYANMNSGAPAGGINSSAAEMAQWCRLYLNDGLVDGQQIIAKDILDEMKRPQMPLPINNVPEEVTEPMGGPGYGQIYRSYGLGLRQTDYRGRAPVIMHGGNIDGMLSFFVIFPKQNLCITTLTNTSTGREIGTHIADWIAASYLGIDNSNLIEVVKRDFKLLESKRGGMEKFLASIQQKNTSPSLDLKTYVGTYSHPAFGTVTISKDNNQLLINIGESIKGTLTHFHHDTFLADWIDINQQAYLRKMLFEFKLNHNKTKLTQVAILGSDSLVFKRQ